MDPNQFRYQVRDALAHLYDQAYLETHPLVAFLKVDHSNEPRGTALQHVLLDAIQGLRPSPDLPYSSVSWRKYRYLFLRYAQAVPLPEIGSDLGISLRQARRHSYDALTAVAALLWDRYCTEPEEVVATETPNNVDLTVNPVDQEVVHIEAQAHEMPVSIGELLVGVVNTIRPLAERRGVALSITLPDTVPTASVDRGVLRQVLLNVLTLTLKVGRAVGLAVEASTGDAEVRISIRVTLTMDVEAATQLVTVDDRWYIARHLLQAQRGHAEVLPTSGTPLTICVCLRSVPRSKILVVEDNHDVITLYRRYLSDSPYQILDVTDGSVVVDVAATEQPAAILLDVMMPAQDGWEILQFLQGRPETQGIPVIVCSILREKELALTLGATDLLVKPVSRPVLLQALAQHCRP